MKLTTKTILYYLVISLPLLVIAGIVSYLLIKTELRDSTDEYLWKEKLNAEKIISSLQSPAIIYLNPDSLSKVIPVTESRKGYTYADSTIYDQFEEEELNYRILKAYYNAGTQNYLIVISKSTLEDDDLMESLFKSFVLIVLLLVLAFFVLNWILSKTLWKPFYNTVEQLNNYEIKNHSVIKFESPYTKEFKELNQSLTVMTEKIFTDYIQQKEFTENASHEMQTPLAVIKANIGLLMQSPNISEEDMNLIQSLENSVKKLTSLNKTLLLLSKIENNQFIETSNVQLNDLVAKVLDNYIEAIDLKHIETEFNNTSHLDVYMNPMLAEILIGNLIQNAVRHNKTGGKIKVELLKDSLIVSNTGDALAINPSELFLRFKKNDASKESLGLGLSIVQSILNLYNFKIDYSFKEGFHVFCIKFN